VLQLLFISFNLLLICINSDSPNYQIEGTTQIECNVINMPNHIHSLSKDYTHATRTHNQHLTYA